MSIASLCGSTKTYALYYLGMLDEDKAPKSSPPGPPPKPVGKLRIIENWLKLAALLGLMGYFIYLLVSVFTDFIDDLADPPLKVSVGPAKSKTEPKFPAIAFCNTGYNRSINLIQIGVQVSGNSSSDVNCYPAPGNDSCETGFPSDQLLFWQFSIRHDDPTDSRRRRRLVSDALQRRIRQSPSRMADSRQLQDEGGDDSALPNTNGEYDVKCIAMDASPMSGYTQARKPRPRQLSLLFSFTQAPGDIEIVQTPGLRGLDVFFFGDVNDLPGVSLQNRSEGIFNGLYDTPELISAEGFEDLDSSSSVVGQDALTYMGISQSQFTENGGPPSYRFDAVSTTTALNIPNFVNPFNPEVGENETATDTRLAFVFLSYDTALITFYDKSPPSFAEFLGNIGGLKSILFDFWALALLVLASMTRVQAYNNRVANGAPTSNPKGAQSAVVVVATDKDDA